MQCICWFWCLRSNRHFSVLVCDCTLKYISCFVFLASVAEILWRLNFIYFIYFIYIFFRTICLFHLCRQVHMKYGWIREKLEYLYGKRFGSKIAWANRSGYFRAKPFPVWILFSNPAILHTYLPMKMEQTECSETSAYKIQTAGNYPEERIQRLEHGESLKSV